MKRQGMNLIRKLSLLLMVLIISVPIWAQQNVTGVVYDDTNVPLIGVNIIIQGTTTGTITDSDGKYSLSVPTDGILEYSFVGMVTKAEPVNGRNLINVTMESEFIGVMEIVAVGYGTMRKVDVTGAVSSVSGEKIAESGTFSAAQALQGKLSGVTVVNNGDAGSDAKIRIRGINTIGNNNPLIVVDGVTNGASISNINPADIESIDVLKDASALAIYGSRASNGVILITTKSGSYGKQEMQVSVNASYGIAKMNQRLDLTNSAELVDMIDEARLTENEQIGGRWKTYDQTFFVKDANGKPVLDAAGNKVVDQWGRQTLTDWQDELFNTGTVQDYSISAFGGSEKAKYAFGISYRDQEGVMPGNYAKRYVARGSVETKVLKDKLKLGTTFNYSLKESRGSQQGSLWSSDLFNAAITPRNIPAYFEEGSPYEGAPYQETDPSRTAYFTSGGSMENTSMIYDDYSNPNHNIVATIYADLEIIKGLNFKTSYTQNYSQNYRRNYRVQSLNPLSDALSDLNVSSSRNYSTSWDNTLTYDKKIGLLAFNVMVGATMEDYDYNAFGAWNNGFPEGDIEGLRYLPYAVGLPTVDEEASNSRLYSTFGRLNLNMADKYLFTATVRRDGSSRFYKDADTRWGVFPSFSAGWRISEEEFLKSVSWLDYLKIRASWGQVGNQSIGNRAYAYTGSALAGFGEFSNAGGASLNTDAAFGVPGASHTGRVVSQLGVKGITWETTTMQNIGLDFSAFGVSGSLELFQNNTVDMLLAKQFPQIVGIYPSSDAAPRINGGEVETKGVEFNLNYSGKKGDFSYSIGANYTYSKNEILSLSENLFVEGAGDSYKGLAEPMSRAYVGDEIGSFYGHNIIGIFNTQEEVDAYNQAYRDKLLAVDPTADVTNKYYISPKTAPGDYIFEDIDNNGTITADDIKNLGSGNPRTQYGLNFNCGYKSFDFSLNLVGVTGISIYSMLEAPLSLPKYYNTLSSVEDHWTPENHTATNPRYTVSDPNGNLRASSKWIHDGSYLRFQNIILGYSLPKNVVSYVGLSKLRVFVNVQNLFTITNYPFLDPEVRGDSGDLDLSAGVDTGTSPLPRTILFGLDINF